jgi:exonuclease VII small subunit
MESETYKKLSIELEVARFLFTQALQQKKRAEKSLERANARVSKASQNVTKAIEACNLYTQAI